MRLPPSLLLVTASLGLAACTHPPDPPVPALASSSPPAAVVLPPSPAPEPAAAPSPVATPAPPSAATYPWLSDPGAPVPEGALEGRFAPPSGFVRAELPARTFGAWLRGLPLMPPGTPVKSFRGQVVLPPDHENLAAVVAIDVGSADLQQCADSVIRLHAEWLFAAGRRDQSYRAASGTAMPFARWARGERMVQEGMGFSWMPSARADGSRASFRRWLDGVFGWANTGSLAREAVPVSLDDLRPGDFVVQPGGPGHAVLVLDLARAPDGRRALLLGQGFMPAQSFQVLRPGRHDGRDGPWFIVQPGDTALDTPFWPAFPYAKTLRRFAGT
jgi:hypothetical protein